MRWAPRRRRSGLRGPARSGQIHAARLRRQDDHTRVEFEISVVALSGIPSKTYSSSREVAEIATKTRPGLLILYHRANPGGVGRPNPEQVLLEEVRQHYGGKVVIGHDLDVF